MVVQRFFCAFFLVPTLLSAASISVSIDEEKLGPGRPVTGKIQVTREDSEEMNPDSFMIGDDPLQVQKVGESSRSSFSVINGKKSSRYELVSQFLFQTAEVEEGVTVLPPITVEVEGKEVSSGQIRLQVEEALEADSIEMELLQALPEKLYPGQRIALGYRVRFRERLELTEQQLPLLAPEGFRTVGESHTRSYSSGHEWIEEVWQELEAENPGEYKQAESFVEGYRYQQDWFGRRTLLKPRLRASLPEQTLSVVRFPAPQPASFTGTIGNFRIKGEVKGASEVVTGDKVTFELIVEGEGEWQTVSAPDLKRKEAFLDGFRLSDLPPRIERTPGRVTITYELRPLRASLSEVPALEWSIFDPASGYYTIRSTEPIPLVVREPEAQPPLVEREPLEEDKEEPLVKSEEGINIHPFMAAERAGWAPSLLELWGLAALAGAILLLFEWCTSNRSQSKEVPLSLQEEMRRALDKVEPLQAVEQLLSSRDLDESGRRLLIRIQESRYSGLEQRQTSQLLKEVKEWASAQGE